MTLAGLGISTGMNRPDHWLVTRNNMAGDDEDASVVREYNIVAGMMVMATVAIILWCFMIRKRKRPMHDDSG